MIVNGITIKNQLVDGLDRALDGISLCDWGYETLTDEQLDNLWGALILTAAIGFCAYKSPDYLDGWKERGCELTEAFSLSSPYVAFAQFSELFNGDFNYEPMEFIARVRARCKTDDWKDVVDSSEMLAWGRLRPVTKRLILKRGEIAKPIELSDSDKASPSFKEAWLESDPWSGSAHLLNDVVQPPSPFISASDFIRAQVFASRGGSNG